VPRDTLLKLLEALVPSNPTTTISSTTSTAANTTTNSTATIDQVFQNSMNGPSSGLTALNQLNQPVKASIGIGLDSCVIPLRHSGLSLIQTTDFFYPLIEDPYIMGLL
jgi:hypothetical protein